VSSANRHGLPPATTCAQAQEQLGEAVSVYLDGGPCPDILPSTIVDLTGVIPRVLREGAISVDRLRKVAAVIAPGAEVPAPAADVEKEALPHPMADGPFPIAGGPFPIADGPFPSPTGQDGPPTPPRSSDPGLPTPPPPAG